MQVCTAAMHHGHRIVTDMIDGLSNWMDAKGYATLDSFRGLATANYVPWGSLNVNFRTVARIDPDLCISCGKCYIACEDTSHQSIAKLPGRIYRIIEDECVGCNLCAHVCPVERCITMVPQPATAPAATWALHPNNPHRTVPETTS